MRYFSLAFKNSLRNRRRSILTISSVAMSLCLLGVLIGEISIHRQRRVRRCAWWSGIACPWLNPSRSPMKRRYDRFRA